MQSANVDGRRDESSTKTKMSSSQNQTVALTKSSTKATKNSQSKSKTATSADNRSKSSSGKQLHKTTKSSDAAVREASTTVSRIAAVSQSRLEQLAKPRGQMQVRCAHRNCLVPIDAHEVFRDPFNYRRARSAAAPNSCCLSRPPTVALNRNRSQSCQPLKRDVASKNLMTKSTIVQSGRLAMTSSCHSALTTGKKQPGGKPQPQVVRAGRSTKAQHMANNSLSDQSKQKQKAKAKEEKSSERLLASGSVASDPTAVANANQTEAVAAVTKETEVSDSQAQDEQSKQDKNQPTRFDEERQERKKRIDSILRSRVKALFSFRRSDPDSANTENTVATQAN